jgi:hypothetical protein
MMENNWQRKGTRRKEKNKGPPKSKQKTIPQSTKHTQCFVVFHNIRKTFNIFAICKWVHMEMAF